MKQLKKIFKIIIVVLILVLISGWFFIQTLQPEYDGELKLDNLSDKVTVFYDEFGVPHINAENEQDAFNYFLS